MTSKKINLIYQLNGPGIEEGVDVFKLSPLLLSIGELIQDSQAVVHPQGHQLGVNIKPFRKGSYIVELALYAKTNLQQIINIVNTDSFKEIKELLEWIGLIGGSTIGAIKIYKWLKGQPKKFEEAGPDEIKIINKDDNSITVNKKAFSLFQSSKIQQNIYNIYGNFLGQEGINTVETYLDNDKKTGTEVKKDEVSYFNPANTIPLEGDENEKRNITRPFLKPKRVSLEGEPDNWSFRKGEDAVITATIKDKDFLDKINSGEIRLAREDTLEVDLLEVQTMINNEVHVKYEIIKVHDYKKAPVQRTFFDSESN